MKDCRTCKYGTFESSFTFCEIGVPDEVFVLDCEKAECPTWEAEE